MRIKTIIASKVIIERKTVLYRNTVIYGNTVSVAAIGTDFVVALPGFGGFCKSIEVVAMGKTLRSP